MSWHRRSAAFAAVALLLATPPDARAIFGGTVDATRSAVVLITRHFVPACSGVLIAPRVVATAAYCFDFDPDPFNYEVVADTMLMPFPQIVGFASELHLHPDYVGGERSHDIGVLVLAEDLGVAPLRWLAVDPGSVYAEGTGFDSVGFGVLPGLSGLGTRRSVSIDVDAVDETVFFHDQTDGKGPCTFDEGGPAITDVAGVATVIGVASQRDENCAQLSSWSRTDAHSAFLATFAPEPAPAPLAAAATLALALAASGRARWRSRERSRSSARAAGARAGPAAF